MQTEEERSRNIIRKQQVRDQHTLPHAGRQLLRKGMSAGVAYINASSNAFASWRSAVSKPSVNQP
jgi:hypothetical protein